MTLTIFWPFFSSHSSSSSSPLAQSNERSPSLSIHHFANPSVSPPSARMDRKHKARERKPLRIWHLWKYGFFIATKGAELSAAVIAHNLWGPRKKSWGIEMTLITAFMRGAGKNSTLINIPTIRMFMSLGGLVPLPSDALVTPVSFRVKKRGLRGLLAEYDAQETGTRELSGEWVVGKKTWLRLQADWKESRKSEKGDKKKDSERPRELVVLYIHGGAYYLGSAASQRLISIPLAKYTDARVFAIDYRLAPETRFPGPVLDVVSAYLRLVEDLHIPPENIIVAGDSAGGGLSLALLMYLRDNSYPLPAGSILMSPWVDLTMSCESWDSNAAFDVLPIPTSLPDDHHNPIALYLGDRTEEYLTHPYVSPLFGDFTGLPPMLIQGGDAEVLRDEITLLAHKATAMGVSVRHELYADAIHIFQAYPFLEATRQAFNSCRDFVRNILPQVQKQSPQRLDGEAEAVLENEIDNEKATVVRGDGVETTSGIKQAKKEFEQSTDTSDDDESSADFSKYRSWGRSTRWFINDDNSSQDENDIEKAVQPPSPVQPGRRRSKTLPASSSMQRLQSAISCMIPPETSPPKLSPTPIRRHKRTASYQPRADSIRIPPFTLASQSCTATPLPSPSIRRTNTSHADISSLVDQWTQEGPANRIHMYRPRQH